MRGSRRHFAGSNVVAWSAFDAALSGGEEAYPPPVSPNGYFAEMSPFGNCDRM